MSSTEEELVTLLSGVLLNDDIDGLDEDLVQYIAGLVSTQLADENSDDIEDTLDEAMVPFLDSVGCPSELVEQAKTAIVGHYAAAKNNTSSPAPPVSMKLKQGVVNMSSTLSEQTENAASAWEATTTSTVKANANTQIDAYHDKSSAKERRKQRQDLEKQRRELEKHQQHEDTDTKAGVSAMVLPTVKGKDMDVNLPNITLSLDNGTLLLEQGDLKLAYQVRTRMLFMSLSFFEVAFLFSQTPCLRSVATRSLVKMVSEKREFAVVQG